MLDKDWLATCAPIGTFNPVEKIWRAAGAGVFIYQPPYIWYVTAHHVIDHKQDPSFCVLINHSQGERFLMDIRALHAQHAIHWVIDKENDIAATLFPVAPHFEIKAIEFAYFLPSTQLLPSMKCYSVGCPYATFVEHDANRVMPYVLDGIISGVDLQQRCIYTTAPTFPGNSGGPLFIWKDPSLPNGSITVGEQIVYFGGIISQYVLISHKETSKGVLPLPPLHLGKAIPAEAIQMLLQSSEAKKVQQKIKQTAQVK